MRTPKRLIWILPDSPRQLLTSAEAVNEAFECAHPDNWYPILQQVVRVDDRPTLPFKAVLHRDAKNHDEYISTTTAPTFWNLVSYRPSAIKKNGRFTFTKADAFALHGTFIDFDGGRKIGDDKWDEAGRLLTQREIWREVNCLIAAGVIPPFQLWADGTRGCYGALLFKTPEPQRRDAQAQIS